jgi:hypothetical protein
MTTSLIAILSFAGGVLVALVVMAARRSNEDAVNRGRVTTMLSAAKRYSLGDLTRPAPDYGDDNLGKVASAIARAWRRSSPA